MCCDVSFTSLIHPVFLSWPGSLFLFRRQLTRSWLFAKEIQSTSCWYVLNSLLTSKSKKYRIDSMSCYLLVGSECSNMGENSFLHSNPMERNHLPYSLSIMVSTKSCAFIYSVPLSCICISTLSLSLVSTLWPDHIMCDNLWPWNIPTLELYSFLI